MAAMIYARPKYAIKMQSEVGNPEGKTLTKAEGTVEITENTAIKRETTGETNVDKK